MHKEQGFTLLEVLVSATLTAMLIAVALQILRVSQSIYAYTFAQDSLRAQAEITLHRILQELEDVSKTSIVSVDDSGLANLVDNLTAPLTSITDPLGLTETIETITSTVVSLLDGFTVKKYFRYRKIIGIDEQGQPMFTDEHYAFVMEPEDGEIDENNIDDNGNGLVDEKKLILKMYGTRHNAQDPEYGDNNGSEVANEEGTIIAILGRNFVTKGPEIPPDYALFKCIKSPTKNLWTIQASLAMAGIATKASEPETILAHYTSSTILK